MPHSSAGQSALFEPVLSPDLRAVIGLASVDVDFQDALLAHPRRALAFFDLAPGDRQAAASVRGAHSLADYAVQVEKRLANQRRVAARQVA
jgi:hypothetical protein